ncbi:MAG: hypothetical protein AAGM67_17425, partial [Bacteroidota bacterium]
RQSFAPFLSMKDLSFTVISYSFLIVHRIRPLVDDASVDLHIHQALQKDDEELALARKAKESKTKSKPPKQRRTLASPRALPASRPSISSGPEMYVGNFHQESIACHIKCDTIL